MGTELMACREALAALQAKYAYEVDSANALRADLAALRADNERLRARVEELTRLAREFYDADSYIVMPEDTPERDAERLFTARNALAAALAKKTEG